MLMHLSVLNPRSGAGGGQQTYDNGQFCYSDSKINFFPHFTVMSYIRTFSNVRIYARNNLSKYQCENLLCVWDILWFAWGLTQIGA